MAYNKLKQKRGRWYVYFITSYRDHDGVVRKRERYAGPASPEQVAAWLAKRNGVTPHKAASTLDGRQKRPERPLQPGDLVRHDLARGWIGRVVRIEDGRVWCTTVRGHDEWADRPTPYAVRYLALAEE